MEIRCDGEIAEHRIRKVENSEHACYNPPSPPTGGGGAALELILFILSETGMHIPLT
jgi:hypothetical protein